MGKQTVTGKAFEYACLMAIQTSLTNGQEIKILDDKSFNNAKSSFEELPAVDKAKNMKAAYAAVEILFPLEPRLEHADNAQPLILAIQPDKEGISGDVRDVLCMRTLQNWEIGLSCKHNHDAVKHSRLSSTIDFGKEWMETSCSEEYWNEIRPVFNLLKSEEVKETKWRNIPNKHQKFYRPILEAFLKEMKRICESNSEAPQKLIGYLLGTHDFYKVISREKDKTTIVKVFNIKSTLNKPSKSVHSVTRIKTLRLPTRLIDLTFFDGRMGKSDTSVELTFDQGWQIKFRIHSASTIVEPSLKFDITLIGNPTDIHTQMRCWEN